MRKMLSILLALLFAVAININVATDTAPPVTAQTGVETATNATAEDLPAEMKSPAESLCAPTAENAETSGNECADSENTISPEQPTTEIPSLPTAPETTIPETEQTESTIDSKNITTAAESTSVSEPEEEAISITVTVLEKNPVAQSEPEPNETDCIDEGDSELAPYTPPSNTGTPNPFANPQPNGVTDIPAEDLIQPGDDMPGQGIHF